MAFEVQQRFPHGIALPDPVHVGVGVAVRERRGSGRGRPLKCRAGQTEKVRWPDQKGLQSYVSRYLGGGGGGGSRGGRDFYISHLTDAFIPSDSGEVKKKPRKQEETKGSNLSFSCLTLAICSSQINFSLFQAARKKVKLWDI